MVQIKLERIGDDTNSLMRLASGIIDENLGKGLGKSVIGNIKHREWCAEITGFDKKYKFSRLFLKGKVSYLESNSCGSRGVYSFYNLENNKIYEINSPISWKKDDRYFCIVENDRLNKITKDEVAEWLTKKNY